MAQWRHGVHASHHQILIRNIDYSHEDVLLCFTASDTHAGDAATAEEEYGGIKQGFYAYTSAEDQAGKAAGFEHYKKQQQGVHEKQPGSFSPIMPSTPEHTITEAKVRVLGTSEAGGAGMLRAPGMIACAGSTQGEERLGCWGHHQGSLQGAR